VSKLNEMAAKQSKLNALEWVTRLTMDVIGFVLHWGVVGGK